MDKKELVANDPMEMRLMSFAETVNKVSLIVMGVILFGAIVTGVLVAASDLLIFAVIVIPAVVLDILIWLAKELVCLWLENQTEMHCYARMQTEILMGMEEKK